jgi:hypothetical protein
MRRAGTYIDAWLAAGAKGSGSTKQQSQPRLHLSGLLYTTTNHHDAAPPAPHARSTASDSSQCGSNGLNAPAPRHRKPAALCCRHTTLAARGNTTVNPSDRKIVAR